MNTFKISVVSVAAFGLMAAAGGASAAALDPGVYNRAQPVVLEKAQYVWAGRNYCWYDGWHGPGWYWCGYGWRRGFGWGGPEGWRGWHYGRGPGWHDRGWHHGWHDHDWHDHGWRHGWHH